MISTFILFLLIGVILIICELISTSLYLLIIGIGFIIASFLSFLNFNVYYSTLFAGIFAIIGCFIIYRYKKPSHSSKMIVNHIGQEVRVTEINNYNIQVFYSGTYWQAKVEWGDPFPAGYPIKFLCKFPDDHPWHVRQMLGW